MLIEKSPDHHVTSTYPCFLENMGDSYFFQYRAISAATNTMI